MELIIILIQVTRRLFHYYDVPHKKLSNVTIAKHIINLRVTLWIEGSF